MIEDILKEYQHLCVTDENKRRKLYCYNYIQCVIIAHSGLDSSVWVTFYAVKFSEVVAECENEEQIEMLLYK